MLQHILYRNDTAHILVVDLPASIACAQSSTRRLCSTPALETPYQTPEPKGAKREELLSRIPAAEHEYHRDLQDLIENKLTFLHQQWHEPAWCAPRASCNTNQISVQPDCLSHRWESLPTVILYPPPLVLSPGQNRLCCSSAFTGTVVHNPYSCSTELVVSTHESFTIPPNATFLCASIQEGERSFEAAMRCLRNESCFDLVLLDPPWSNRSVRRSQVYKSAETQLLDPFGQTFTIVNRCLGNQGYLAVWVTNKAGVRAQVLGTCQSNGFVLIEEWTWVKVTVKGEPMTPLHGVWRKPYEILLLFRRNSEPQEVVRSIIVAVPDVHSRKPSLKTMFDQFLPRDYSVLEVFARSLTAGWWSWGDETLKFQHDSHWQ